MAVAPAIVLAAPLLHKSPLNADHPVHLFYAWHFWTEMLGRGRLHGWTHMLAFGYPAGELIPWGSEAWVALFRALTWAQLPWTRTYALAFGGFLVFKALATYRFARAYFGVAAGVAAAWVMSWDPGAMLQGGWVWHTQWGVWPVSLAMCFVALSLARLREVLAVGRTRNIFAAGAWLGAALLTHPLSLIVFAVVIPLLLLDHLFFTRVVDMRPLSRVVAALLFGGALGAFYWVPVLFRGSETRDLGWMGEPLSVVLGKLFELRTFENVWSPMQGLSVAGAVLALRSRRRGSVFVVAAALAFVVLSSDVMIRDLHLERAIPDIVKIEFTRNLLVAKLFWFPLAGFALVAILRGPALLRRRAPRWGTAAYYALVISAVAALLVPVWPSFYATQVQKPIQGESGAPLGTDLQGFFAWSKNLRESTSANYRIAYHLYRGNHLLMLAPVFNGTAFHKVGTATHQFFNKVPVTDENELFQALSVKYVMSAYELDNAKLALDRRFGDLWVYRFTDFRPEPFTVIGNGHAEILQFDPERIRIRLRDTRPDTRLKIHVASHPNWRATIGGRELPISTVAVYGAEYPVLMEVPARDGELVLEYVHRAPDWTGHLLALCALPAFVGVEWFRRRGPRFERWLSRLEALVRAKAWMALPLLVAVAATLAVRTINLRHILPVDSIFHHLDGRNVTADGYSCFKQGDSEFSCGSHSVKADAIAGAWGVHRCVGAPGVGQVRIRRHMQLGSFLHGNYDPAPDQEGRIRLEVNGAAVGEVVTRPSYLWGQYFQFDTRAFQGRDVDVDLSIEGAALHCFDLQLVP